MADAQRVPGREIMGSTIRPDQDYRVKLYDFKRPDKFTAEQIHTLRLIHDTLARLATPVLSQIVETPIEVRCHGVDQLAFYEFFESIPKVCAFVPLSMAPLRASVLMEIDGEVARALAMAACGSRRAQPRDEPLSEMEALVVRDIADRLAPSIDGAWSTAVSVTTSSMSIETEPQYVQIVPPTEMIVLAQLEVLVGQTSGFVNLAIPFITIEPILSRLRASWWFRQVRMKSGPLVSTTASTVPVGVDLIAAPDPIALSRLPAILAGEPLPLSSLATGGVSIRAGGVTVAECEADADALSSDGVLRARVLSHGAPAQEVPAADQMPLSRLLGDAVESLTRQIRDVKQTVDQLRADRDVLVDLEDIRDDTVGPGIDPRHHKDVASVLRSEPPEIIAFLLTGMSPELAASVISDLDPEHQTVVLRAVEGLHDGETRLLRKLLTHVARRLSRTAETSTSGGVSAVVSILNLVPRSVEKNVMDDFQKSDKELFERIARLMFVFEDFVLVDGGAIRKVAERVSIEELALALKGVHADVSTHILDALDSEYAKQLVESIEALGRVRRQDVESAQRDMIEELRQLEEMGEVVVARPDEVVE